MIERLQDLTGVGLLFDAFIQKHYLLLDGCYILTIEVLLEEIKLFILLGSENPNLISVVDNVCLSSMKTYFFQILFFWVEILRHYFFGKNGKTFVSLITLIHLLYIFVVVEIFAYKFLQLFFLQGDHGWSDVVVDFRHNWKVTKFQRYFDEFIRYLATNWFQY